MIQYLTNHDFYGFLIVAVTLVVAISLHEFGHALADEVQGDPTARLAGRLTINPLRHMDPIGTLMIVIVGFGWGKPVPISPASLRNRRFGAAIIGMAGPVVNMILALLTALLVKDLNIPLEAVPGVSFADRLIASFLFINILLAVFNLIPIPPLDGSRVLSAVLPPNKQKIVFWLDQYGFLLLILAAFLGLLGAVPQAALTVESWLLQAVGYRGF